MVEASAAFANIFIVISLVVGFFFAFVQYFKVSKIRVSVEPESDGAGLTESLTHSGEEGKGDEYKVEEEEGPERTPEQTEALMHTIHSAISEGATAFLWEEYKVIAIYVAVFAVLVFTLVGSAGNCGDMANVVNKYNVTVQVATHGSCWTRGGFSAISFVLGCATSVAAGYVGMRVATYANVRTVSACQRGWTAGFNTAFRAGSVMGFFLASMALMMVFVAIHLFRLQFDWEKDPSSLFESIAGYGLGGSSVALFARVGGGIYTKAADVGADLVGKVEQNLAEDDERNPAVIADNVGDNVGDIAGLGADLFGSFAEATCASLVIAASIADFSGQWASLMFPLLISAVGLLGCVLTAFFATDIPFLHTKEQRHIERNLKYQLIISTVVLLPLLYLMAHYCLPSKFCAKLSTTEQGHCEVESSDWKSFLCIASGLVSGLVVGYYTEYMTSHSYRPVREVAEASSKGHAINIIFGLALGYKSVVVPVFFLAATVFLSFSLADTFGVSLAALGMICNVSTALSVDGFGPIADNAGGIAEMCGMKHVRKRTDALDAAGNTTAAIGKGFAIGSAALVGLALFSAFVTRANIDNVDLLKPVTFAALLIGAMIPYWFSALTVKSVGDAAQAMVEEVRRQIQEHPGILDRTEKPNYQSCVAISTRASIREMIAPGALVLLSPIIVGAVLGVNAVTGLLAGAIASAVQMATSAANSGGAWDNAKKYIEGGVLGGKGSPSHAAAVTGDTVGDPLKDTSGPSLNIVMKLMAIISLVFAPFFVEHSIWTA
eukprot:CAMPEP_0196781264 /NCGR_PEP_ID=MMETSP1104-20130614/9360_1 /TAXON_ID=33652 /ORGANISM="Cafeteria sp., Strain Caron Lab Isolate" /LENGTH=776 /DNA_ID=CAMNT_0042151487 /DNA_START=16 /DNA_END=2346 /DNA_ORIENTATION=+